MLRERSANLLLLLLILAASLTAVTFGDEDNSSMPKECYVCNSKDDANCGTHPKDIKTTVFCEDHDSCAFGFVGDNIYRNCASQLEFVDKIMVCTGNLCNHENWSSYDVQDENGETINSDNETTTPKSTTKKDRDEGTTKKDTDEETSPDERTTTEAATTTEPPRTNHVRQECIQCNSTNNGNCISNAETLAGLDCNAATTGFEGCFVRKEGQNLIRGCASDLTKDDLAACKDNPNKCTYCPDRNCNTQHWPQCYNCSSETNPNCSQWVNGDQLAIEICDEVGDKCAIQINSHGQTIRSCVRAEAKCEAGNLCHKCDSDICNTGLFPADRVACHQCSGTADCQDKQDAMMARPCVQYMPADGCFMYANLTGKMIRGCMSDGAVYEKCKQAGERCKLCKGDAGCNDGAMMTQPQLACSKCSMEEGSCPWQQRDDSVTKCSKSFLYYLEETCRILYNKTTMRAERGCSLDLGVCSDDDTNCKVCRGDGCNKEGMTKQTCIQCDSQRSNETSCATDAKDIAAGTCASEMQFFDNRGCYTKNSDKAVSRGCVSDLTVDLLALCDDPKFTNCTICMGQGCNANDLKSLSWMLISSVNTVFMAAFVVTYFM